MSLLSRLTSRAKRHSVAADEDDECACSLPRSLPFFGISPPHRRPITPLPDSTLSEATSASPFFGLPRELRDQILTVAFGRQTIHIGLWDRHNHDDPLHEFPRYKWTYCFCPCDCQAHPVRIPTSSPPGPLPRLHACTRSFGAFGWLLSCRRAYAEAIPILYERNTFHLNGKGTLANAGASGPLSPHHAATVRNLTVSLKPLDWSLDEVFGLAGVVRRVRVGFPALRRLEVVLTTGWWQTWSFWPAQLCGGFMEPMEYLVKVVGGLDVCVLRDDGDWLEWGDVRTKTGVGGGDGGELARRLAPLWREGVSYHWHEVELMPGGDESGYWVAKRSGSRPLDQPSQQEDLLPGNLSTIIM